MHRTTRLNPHAKYTLQYPVTVFIAIMMITYLRISVEWCGLKLCTINNNMRLPPPVWLWFAAINVYLHCCNISVCLHGLLLFEINVYLHDCLTSVSVCLHGFAANWNKCLLARLFNISVWLHGFTIKLMFVWDWWLPNIYFDFR